MKLRNKKTGEIWDIGKVLTCDYPSYETLKQLNEEWEDYKPAEPLIKDEKIRKAVRAWADINDYKKCLVRVYDYDRMGVHFSEGVTSFVSYNTQLGITFFCLDLNIKTETVYTIEELCGEEEE